MGAGGWPWYRFCPQAARHGTRSVGSPGHSRFAIAQHAIGPGGFQTAQTKDMDIVGSHSTLLGFPFFQPRPKCTGDGRRRLPPCLSPSCERSEDKIGCRPTSHKTAEAPQPPNTHSRGSRPKATVPDWKAIHERDARKKAEVRPTGAAVERTRSYPSCLTSAATLQFMQRSKRAPTKAIAPAMTKPRSVGSTCSCAERQPRGSLGAWGSTGGSRGAKRFSNHRGQ